MLFCARQANHTLLFNIRSIHLKASELRLSALNEKKQKVLKSAANHTDSRTKKHLEDIEREIKSLTAKIAAFRQDLASSS
jgi:predicted  nucleic acid-binding Zn-ribbon protein